MNDFELALLDIRKKAIAGQLPSLQSEQQAQQSGNQPGSSNGNKAQPTERQKLSGDGPDTPPKLNSAGSPPPERAPLADSAVGGGKPPTAPPSSLAASMAGQSAGTAGQPADIAEASGSAPGSTAQGGPALSAVAAHSMSPPRPSMDSRAASPPHIPLPPRMSKANRYDLLLGD